MCIELGIVGGICGVAGKAGTAGKARTLAWRLLSASIRTGAAGADAKGLDI